MKFLMKVGKKNAEIREQLNSCLEQRLMYKMQLSSRAV